MAEFVVSFAVGKIAGQLVEEAGSLSNVRDRVEWIEVELRRMQCFLKDAEAKQDGDQRVKNWVADIRDVAYDIDDVIDTFLCKTAQQRKEGFFRLSGRYTFVLSDPVAHWKISKKINRIMEKIHEITDSRSTYGIENIGRGGGRSFATDRLQEKRRSSSHACEEDVVGPLQDIRTLESWLIHGETRLCILSNVGMAGLGKTTLAKKLFHSNDVKKNFDFCGWVYVSQEYRPKDTLQNLVKRVTGLPRAELEKMDKEDLEEALSKFLEEKKYFIFLDDIWKKEVWDDLKAAFPDRKNGSRIIFTTRFKDVALHADPRSPLHEPGLLSDEDGWELLSKKVCLEWNVKTSLPPWSKELGIQIVKRCGGLPLAIVVMGGLLSRKDATFNEWLKVLQSVHWQLAQDPTQCAEILALSYSDLPYYLKSCFLYFGLFPEDYEISARRLILLWVAEGFVQPRGQEPLEDVAEDYLEELVGRSMIQVATRKSNGRIKTCCVHDLLHELSVSKGKEDQFLDIIHGEFTVSSLTRARRLAIHFGVPPTTKNTPKVRSLLCFDICEPSFQELRKFKLLRILDLEGVYISRLDSSIGNLIHLRYLGLRGTWLKKLPPSIQFLLNLQTLDLRSTLLNPIPIVIWKMQKLRHLYFNELEEMAVNPPTDASLANLQTLHGICINQNSYVENGLSKLTNLRELGLHGDLLLHEEAIGKWIFSSERLECLKLHTRDVMGDFAKNAIPKLNFSSHPHLIKLHLKGFMAKLFDAEYFPQNLTELSLKGSFLMEDPMVKLEMLQSLRVLKLKQSAYVGKEMICSCGGFPQLHFLKLSFLNTVERWRIEDGAMGRLRQLEIIECKRLKIVPRGLHPVTTIHKLKLGYMPHEFEMKVQERQGENWYRIEHVLPI